MLLEEHGRKRDFQKIAEPQRAVFRPVEEDSPAQSKNDKRLAGDAEENPVAYGSSRPRWASARSLESISQAPQRPSRELATD